MPKSNVCLLHDDLYTVDNITQTSLLIDVIFARGTAQRCTLTRSCLVIIQFLGLGTYSKVPIIRTGTYASSAVHTMYCQNCPMFGTYNRSFRVLPFIFRSSNIPDKNSKLVLYFKKNLSKHNCQKNLDGKNYYCPKNLDGKNHYYPRILTTIQKLGSSRISFSLFLLIRF